MATVQARPESTTLQQSEHLSGILLQNVLWQTYEALIADSGEQYVRLTYDRGRLEIVSPSSEHERYGYFLGRMIDIITEELRIPMDGSAP